MKKEQEIEKNPSTEELIKDAARRVFIKKGYAATRTRDIAEESGFNLALINYYFRSKEKLFDLILVEHLQLFLQSVMGLLNDPATTLQQKIELVISHYIDMLVKNPGLPMFVLNEVSNDPTRLISKVGADKIKPLKLLVIQQWEEMTRNAKKPVVNPIHMLMNIASMTIFPFLGSPIIRNRTGISEEQFIQLMEERKKLIPIWIDAIIKTSFASE